MKGLFSRIAAYDPALLAHSTRVAAFCRAVAPVIGLAPQEAEVAGLLYDQGKVMSPREEPGVDTIASPA